MTTREFTETLTQWDVVLLQETHMRPGQEEQLALPRGYQCHALSRAVPDDLSQPHGGLLAIFREHVPLTNITPPTETEFMMLTVGEDLLLVNVYIPPVQSPWLRRPGCNTPPLDHLLECLQPALANDTPILLLGDFNARIGSLHTGLPRIVVDNTTTARGRQLLDVCRELDLHILNGTSIQSAQSHARFTSYQHAGQSVIDLALASSSLLTTGALAELEVCDHAKDWSDHAALSITMRLPQRLLHRASTNEATALRRHKADNKPLPPLSQLDNTLHETLRPLRNKSTPLLTHYGTPWMQGTPLQLYLATAEPEPQPDGSRPGSAGAGLYWGPSNAYNAPVSVGGPQSASRAAIAAATLAILTADHSRELRIHTDSEFLIRAVCHWAPQNARDGWKCPHSDLLQPLDDILKARPAPVAFYAIASDNRAQSHARAAATLAQRARLSGPCLLDFSVLRPPAHWPARPAVDLHRPSDARPDTQTPTPKVHTPVRNLSAVVEPMVRGDRLGDLDTVCWDVPGYQSAPILATQRRHLQQLLSASSDGAFWTAFRALTCDKVRHVDLAAENLKSVFEVRMNPPQELPPAFDPMTHAVNRAYAQALPDRTIDNSQAACFSRPISVDEINDVKAHIRKHCKGSARGMDGIGYDDVLSLESDDLRELFQSCIDSREAPSAWITAIIAAIKKPGKDGSKAESYRTIGLESCLLKTLTLLIDRRLREWAEGEEHIPDSQSGFRKGQRTTNNAYILRTAIEKARALGRPLYVAFLDLTNAFPSVDQPTLWTKLTERGAGGPMLDWLRMIYARLRYVVRFQGDVTDTFRALSGILTGDPASPILWAIFLADFQLEPDVDDIILGGTRVSQLELADDIAILSLSARGMQSKLEQFETYCSTTFLLVNVTKTVAMVHGPLPTELPTLLLYGKPLSWTDEATYVGMTFVSTSRNIFARHYTTKAAAARRISSATFSLESYIGRVPTRVACDLYRARVDPHLTLGCEVALDTCAASLESLERVQHTYLRRALGLGSHSQLTPLFTETGLWPIRYRRLELALRYLRYILRDQPPLPAAAFREAWELAELGHPSWWSDLYHALRELPVPVHLSRAAMPTVATVDALLEQLRQSLADGLTADIMTSTRLPLLRTRTIAKRSSDLSDVCAKRPYLAIREHRLRNAMTRLLVSDHPLAIETLRRVTPPVPRAYRVCRFCKRRWAIEDELHVLLECEGPPILAARTEFWAAASKLLPYVQRMAHSMSSPAALDMLLSREKTLVPLAQYIAIVFDLCEDTPSLVIPNDEALLALAP